MGADDLDDVNPYAGTDLYRMTRGLILLGNLKGMALARPGTMVWVLPPEVLPGVSAAWTVPVVRCPGLDGLYLAHRFDEAV